MAWGEQYGREGSGRPDPRLEEVSMAKSKYAPALFEVINSQRKESERLAVPKWFKRAQMAAHGVTERSGPETGRSEAHGHEGGEVAKPAAGGSLAAGESADESSQGTDSPRPTVAWHGKLPLVHLGSDGVAMFFNPMNVAVTAGVLVLALFVSFLAGMAVQSRSKPVAADPNGIEALQGQPKTPGVLGTADGSARSAAKPITDRPSTSAPASDPRGSGSTADASRHEAGVNLVLIETFGLDHKKSAEAVKEWLESEYDLETRLERSTKGWRLLTVKGFDYREPNAEQLARQFCDQLKEAGDQCAKDLAKKKLPVYRLNSPMPVRADK